MGDQEQYKRGPLTYKEVSDVYKRIKFGEIFDMLQSGPTQTPQVSSVTSLLPQSYGSAAAMNGFDPNDIQCCDTSKIGSRIIVEGKYHTVDCPYANSYYNKSYYGTTPVAPQLQPLCDHQFIFYTGLNETFEYCKKCDQKR